MIIKAQRDGIEAKRSVELIIAEIRAKSKIEVPSFDPGF